MMLLSCLWRREQKAGNRPALVTVVGQESLLAYAAHIAVIYGGFFGPFGHSLDYLVGRTRSWAEVALMALLLILATITLALAWHELKKKYPTVAKRVFWTGAFLIAAYMIFRA